MIDGLLAVIPADRFYMEERRAAASASAWYWLWLCLFCSFAFRFRATLRYFYQLNNSWTDSESRQVCPFFENENPNIPRLLHRLFGCRAVPDPEEAISRSTIVPSIPVFLTLGEVLWVCKHVRHPLFWAEPVGIASFRHPSIAGECVGTVSMGKRVILLDLTSVDHLRGRCAVCLIIWESIATVCWLFSCLGLVEWTGPFQVNYYERNWIVCRVNGRHQISNDNNIPRY